MSQGTLSGEQWKCLFGRERELEKHRIDWARKNYFSRFFWGENDITGELRQSSYREEGLGTARGVDRAEN
jgi:hypothetical protein